VGSNLGGADLHVILAIIDEAYYSKTEHIHINKLPSNRHDHR